MSHPTGFLLAVAGGLVAQDPNPSVGTAGLIVALTGLLAGGFQYFKQYLDFKIASRRLDDQDAKMSRLAADLDEAQNKLHVTQMSLSATSQELAESRQRNHDRDDHTNEQLLKMRLQVATNTDVIQGLVPATKAIAEGSGVQTPIPAPPETILTES